MSRQSYMRQVSKEEYEILTRFHPGEIRYYVDVGSATRRKAGETVAAKPRRKVRKDKGKAKTNGSSAGDRFHARPSNSPLQLGTASHEFKEGSISKNIYRLVRLKLQNDPTYVVGRTELVNDIVSSSIYANNQVGPFVSDCLKRGILRYTGDASASGRSYPTA